MKRNIEILRAENLTKYYKCKSNGMFSSIKDLLTNKHSVGIENITFKLYNGEILGITGQGHCGKSTLIKLLSGIIKPSSGQVFFEGKPYTDDQLRKVVHYVSCADIKLDRQLSVIENIIQNFDSDDDRGKIIDRAEELLSTFDLIGSNFIQLKKLPMEAISIICAVVTLINSKPILCIDQPFLHLKNCHMNKYVHEMKNLADKGTSIIVTSTDRENLNRLCSRIIEI